MNHHFEFSEDQEAAALARRDEILQAMYWLAGEGLQQDADAIDLARLLAVDASLLARDLLVLASNGYLEEVPGRPGRFSLTEQGRAEGGRRFADEFAEMHKPGHGECGDPECECHMTGSPADCRHRSV